MKSMILMLLAALVVAAPASATFGRGSDLKKDIQSCAIRKVGKDRVLSLREEFRLRACLERRGVPFRIHDRVVEDVREAVAYPNNSNEQESN